MSHFIFIARAARGAYENKQCRKWAVRTMLCNAVFQASLKGGLESPVNWYPAI